jgi:hypothetical protein
MKRRFWNGKGELQPDEIFFEKHNCTIVGRPYLRRRALRYLVKRWPGEAWEHQRRACIARTVDNDEWLGWFNGTLVSHVCREVNAVMLQS